jgi:putative ABC transport system permease protein
VYEVSTTDPLTFVVVPALVVLIAVMAAAIPARRAARVDPVTVLRAE